MELVIIIILFRIFYILSKVASTDIMFRFLVACLFFCCVQCFHLNPIYYDPNITIYNTGIAGEEYSGSLCDWQSCIPTMNHQIFFCYNRLTQMIVPCKNSTWDPVSDYCFILEVLDTGCTTKKCADTTRLRFLDVSRAWECVNPNGNAKLCGFFNSNADKLYYFSSVSLAGELSNSGFGPGHGAQCEKVFRSWEHRPESMSFSLF